MADTGVESEVSDYSALILTIIVGATVLIIVYISNLLRSQKKEDEEKSPQQQRKKDAGVRDKVSSEAAGQQRASKKKQTDRGRDTKQASFSHPWLVSSLKGHSGRVLDMDFSSNGKYLATCGEDRTLFIWNTKDFTQKEHKSLRINIEFDHASFIKWSPDSKAFITFKALENVIEVYKVTKKPEGGISGATKAITFSKHNSDEVVGLGIACTGRFIMSCTDHTELVLWDLKGQQLTTIDTYLMNNLCARVSPCGRFVAASGFTPDVKVWEVIFSKAGGEYQNTSRAFELKGHTSGIYDFSFSCDSSRMATVSKDGTWKAYDTKIEFEKGEDPHLLKTIPYELGPDGTTSRIALSPDGLVVALATGANLSFYSVDSGKCEATMLNVHAGPIISILFDAAGKYVLTTGDKHVRVFHNVIGYHTKLRSLKASLRSAAALQSSAMRERIQQQIVEAQKFLISLGEKTE